MSDQSNTSTATPPTSLPPQPTMILAHSDNTLHRRSSTGAYKFSIPSLMKSRTPSSNLSKGEATNPPSRPSPSPITTTTTNTRTTSNERAAPPRPKSSHTFPRPSFPTLPTAGLFRASAAVGHVHVPMGENERGHVHEKETARDVEERKSGRGRCGVRGGVEGGSDEYLLGEKPVPKRSISIGTNLLHRNRSRQATAPVVPTIRDQHHPSPLHADTTALAPIRYHPSHPHSRIIDQEREEEGIISAISTTPSLSTLRLKADSPTPMTPTSGMSEDDEQQADEMDLFVSRKKAEDDEGFVTSPVEERNIREEIRIKGRRESLGMEPASTVKEDLQSGSEDFTRSPPGSPITEHPPQLASSSATVLSTSTSSSSTNNTTTSPPISPTLPAWKIALLSTPPLTLSPLKTAALKELDEVFSLKKKGVKEIEEMVEKIFANEAILEDPVVYAKGRGEIVKQLHSIARAFSSTTVLERKPVKIMRDRGNGDESGQVRYDQRMEYHIKGLGTKKIIHSLLVIDFAPNGQITHIRDCWNFKPLPVHAGMFSLRRGSAKLELLGLVTRRRRVFWHWPTSD